MSNDNKLKIVSIIADVLGIISFIVTTITYIAGVIIGLSWIYIIGAIFTVLFFVICFCRKKISYYILKKIMNWTCPDKIYKISKKEVIYEFLSREKMRHEKVFHVEVLHDGFSSIEDKFKWTGDGALTPTAKFNGQKITLLDQKYGMQRYIIGFKSDKRFSKRDKVDPLGMVIENIEDPQRKSSLHLSTGIYAITETLIMKLVFASDLKPVNIRLLEYVHYTDDDHYKCTVGNVAYNESSQKKEVVWEIKKPFFGGKYIIDWQFENE